jgi:replicative DNA helicase
MSVIEINQLPCSRLAEATVLGALITDPALFAQYADVLTEQHFTLEKSRIVFACAVALHRQGRVVDRVTVSQQLIDDGTIEAAGGLSYVADLTSSPEILNLDHWVGILSDKLIRRNAIAAAQALASSAASPEVSTDDVMRRARGIVQELDTRPIVDFVHPLDLIERAGGLGPYLDQFRSSGLRFPWPRLTEMTGGIFPSDLAILAAGTGRGKTAWALNYAHYLAQCGHGVAVFSLEMRAAQILNRLAALQGRWNTAWLKHDLDVHRRDRMARSYADLAEMSTLLAIRDAPGCTLHSLVGSIRRLQARQPVHLVIVDYLQLMTGDGRSRVEQVGSVARGLKLAAMELDVPILALSQFSREHQKAGGKTPELHDLKESSEIEQAANLVIFLHGETRYEQVASEYLDIDCIVAKQRDGAANFKIPMVFRADCGLFLEAESMRPGQQEVIP